MRTILIIVAIVIAIMLIRTLRSKKKAEEPEEEQRFEERTLDDLGVGGVISILGIDYVVQERNRYSAAGTEWYDAKLLGDDNETWWLGWDESDEASLTAEVPFDGIGLTPADLEAMADSAEGEIQYGDETYVLAEASEARYHRSDDSDGEQMYYWDFHDESGEKIVGVVLWSSRLYNAFVGSILPRDQVDILRAAEDEEED